MEMDMDHLYEGLSLWELPLLEESLSAESSCNWGGGGSSPPVGGLFWSGRCNKFQLEDHLLFEADEESVEEEHLFDDFLNDKITSELINDVDQLINSPDFDEVDQFINSPEFDDVLRDLQGDNETDLDLQSAMDESTNSFDELAPDQELGQVVPEQQLIQEFEVACSSGEAAIDDLPLQTDQAPNAGDAIDPPIQVDDALATLSPICVSSDENQLTTYAIILNANGLLQIATSPNYIFAHPPNDGHTITPEPSLDVLLTTESGIDVPTTTESGINVLTTTESGIDVLTTTELIIEVSTTTKSGIDVFTTTESVIDVSTTTTSVMDVTTPPESNIEVVTGTCNDGDKPSEGADSDSSTLPSTSSCKTKHNSPPDKRARRLKPYERPPSSNKSSSWEDDDDCSSYGSASSSTSSSKRRSAAGLPERKRGQNRTAAIRYRQKKRQECEALCTEEDGLKVTNKELNGKVEQLSSEIGYLKGLMKDILIAKGLIKN